MPFRVASAQQSSIAYHRPAGLVDARRLLVDASGDAGNFTICTNWICEEPYGTDAARTIWEYWDAAQGIVHALVATMGAAGTTFQWYMAASKTAIHGTPATVAVDLIGQNIQVYCSYRKDGTFALSDFQTVVRSAAGTEYASSLDTIPLATALEPPVGVTLGNRFNLSGESSALGTATVLVRNDTVRAAGTTVVISDIAGFESPDGPYLQQPTSVLTRVNPHQRFNDRVSREGVRKRYDTR